MSADPFAPLDGSCKPDKKARVPAFVPVLPVPKGAPPAPTRHPQLGEPTAVWTYLGAGGTLLGYVHRYNTAEGGKVFRPLVLHRAAEGTALSWRWQSWHTPRPLYGLDRLAARPEAPVLVAEGEKAADAAAMLLPGHVTVASPGGSKSSGAADWTALRGRHVTIWPDADAPGEAYAVDVIDALATVGAASVLVIVPPEGAAEGWDAADALHEAWTPTRATALVAGAKPAPVPETAPKPEAPAKAKGGRRKRAGGGLLDIAAVCRLWHAPGRETFATYPVGDHVETWPITSEPFKDWLAGRSYAETGTVPSARALDEALRILRQKAYEGPRQSAWMRVGRRSGRLYIDLCDDAWRAIEISGSPLTPEGRCWRVLDRHELPFVRSDAMQDLPVPESEDACAIEELRPFVSTEEEADFRLVVAWLLGALRDNGPYPMLVLGGSQGAGKSFLSTLLRSLVDPNLAPIRSAPRDDRDLFVSATNAHMLCLDNLSSVPAWLSDAMCRLATGGGFAARSMYKDKTETVLQAKRPILLNGIPSLTDRPDLGSRAITVRLRVMSDAERRPEDELERDWEAARPRVLAALCDALSTALRRLPETKLTGSPRLADFAKWITAAEPGLGWEPGAFLAAYADKQREIREDAFEGNAVAVALDAFARERKVWTGTSVQLLAFLGDRVEESVKRQKDWPGTPRALSNAIERIAVPLLRPRGIEVERGRQRDLRTLTLRLVEVPE